MKAASLRRRIAFRLASLSLPLLGLLLLETGLRLGSFGDSYPLFVEAEQDPGYLRVNARVIRRFMTDEAQTPNLRIRPVYFSKRKPAGTVRIFVQGGSTAAGYPYGFGASPAGMLQQRLQRTFPDRKVEVVTTAVSAVNSYTLLDFTDEIVEQEPDAVIIYAGHNEYVGILGVGSGFFAGRWRPVVLSFLWLRKLRVFQLMQAAVSVLSPSKEGRRRSSGRTLMATIAREKRIPYGSPLYELGLRQYRTNLRSILERYRRAGVPVFIGTLVSNEGDLPPFSSGQAQDRAWQDHFEDGRRQLESGDPEAALASFDSALALDDSPALGRYFRAQALRRLGRLREARREYLAAKDRDELRFRAPEEVNRIIRETATEYGAHVVAVQDAFVEASEDGIVGDRLLLEHVHPNLQGYFLLADAFYEALRARRMFASWDSPVSRAAAWEEIPVTEVDRLYGQYRMLKLKSDWPFSDGRGRALIPPPANDLERIAQDYYKGALDWPEALRALLEHHRARGEDFEASRVAVLLAEAFPFDRHLQSAAAEALLKAGRQEASVYRSRASR